MNIYFIFSHKVKNSFFFRNSIGIRLLVIVEIAICICWCQLKTNFK